MNNSIYVDWGGQNIKLTWLPTDQVPNFNQVTSVHGICFHENKILLVHIKGRGFTVPGGHVEGDETWEQALHREAYEEGYVRGAITQYLGMIEVNHQENPLFDSNGKYPLVGYQIFYRMDIIECLSFARENEAIARIWVEPSEFRYVVNDHALINLVVEEALTTIQRN
jgi:8-oxo-dGTP diphosphatase